MPVTQQDVDVVRVRDGRRAPAVDRAATEEPLEVRLHGRPFAVIMRTPGADCELAAGFLLAEGVVRSADDLGTIEHCRTPADAQSGTRQDEPAQPPPDVAANVINVTLTGDALARMDDTMAARRQVTTNSSCGLCGRVTIDSLKADAAPIAGTVRVAASVLVTLPDRLRAAQAVFDRTGGLHAAGLFAADGTLEDIAEDVGRHNAVDKVVGRKLMMDALPLADRLLFVSGRTSFEIVQKALLAGIPIVAAVSAPSSLAIDLARETGVTLVGFVRGTAFNIYSHADRIG
jgi:FdhD protein